MKPLQTEEKEALEKCDEILEGVQDYLRGATNVSEIRRLICARLDRKSPMTPWYRCKGWIFRANFEFKLQDLWVGIFWKKLGHTVDVWICLIPCVPIHVWWSWHDPNQ